MHGSDHVIPPEKKKSSRSTLKYTFATWLHYFHGNITFKGTPLKHGAPTSQHLRRVAILVYWLSCYVFIGPLRESISVDTFIFAFLLAEGVRLYSPCISTVCMLAWIRLKSKCISHMDDLLLIALLIVSFSNIFVRAFSCIWPHSNHSRSRY